MLFIDNALASVAVNREGAHLQRESWSSRQSRCGLDQRFGGLYPRASQKFDVLRRGSPVDQLASEVNDDRTLELGGPRSRGPAVPSDLPVIDVGPRRAGQDRDVIAAAGEVIGQPSSDKPGTARDDNLHVSASVGANRGARIFVQVTSASRIK
jgi:hypothetical protein